MTQLSFSSGKRKYLFCCDAARAEFLNPLVLKVMEEKVPFDFHVMEQGSESFLESWLGQQKMGSYLYISGDWRFVKQVKNVALEAGFSEYEMQVKVYGPVQKNVVCCKCHGAHSIEDQISHITCAYCGVELEVSAHYSRRLDAYLGYVTI